MRSGSRCWHRVSSPRSCRCCAKMWTPGMQKKRKMMMCRRKIPRPASRGKHPSQPAWPAVGPSSRKAKKYPRYPWLEVSMSKACTAGGKLRVCKGITSPCRVVIGKQQVMTFCHNNAGPDGWLAVAPACTGQRCQLIPVAVFPGSGCAGLQPVCAWTVTRCPVAAKMNVGAGESGCRRNG